MSQNVADDVYRVDISDLTPIKVLGDLRWRGKAKFPGSPRPRSIVIFQLGEDVVATSAFCPHEQADLSEARFVEPYVLECPLHQNRYDLRTGAIKTFSVALDGERMYLLWRRSANEPVVPQLTQLRVGKRNENEQNETMQEELRALRDAAKVREAHVVSTLEQMEGMIRSVEEKKREVESSHSELAKVTEFVKRVTDSMSEVLVVIDTAGCVREVNARFSKLLGITRAEAVGMQVDRLVVADQAGGNPHAAFDAELLSGKHDAEIEACLLSKVGERVEHLVRVAPLYGPSGKREGAVLVCTDIQIVKAAQRELKSAYTKVQSLLDNMRQAVFVVLASGEIIQPVSRYTSQLFAQDVVGKNVFHVLYRDIEQNDPVYSGLKTAFLTTFGAEEFQWDLMVDQLPRRVTYKPTAAAHGESSILKVEYCPLRDDSGEMHKLMIIVEDITKIEQLERDRQVSELRTQILEELAKNRSEDLRDFLVAANTQLREARQKLDLRDDAARVTLFRLLHTLKGNARVLGLQLIARATHEAESLAEPLRSAESDSPFLREKVRHAITDLQRQLAEYSAVAERILHVPNEIEARGLLELHRAMCALDAELPQLGSSFKSEPELRAGVASLHKHAVACREAAETLASDQVRDAVKELERVIVLLSHPEATLDSSLFSELHVLHEKLTESVLLRRQQQQHSAGYSLSTSGWTALFLDVYALTQSVATASFEGPDLLSVERAVERAISSASALHAEYVPALLGLVAQCVSPMRDMPRLESLLRELWRHLCLHATLESLALLQAEERSSLLDALERAEQGDQALVALLEGGRVRMGSLVGFFGALRRAGTPAIAVLRVLGRLFDNARPQQVARMLISARPLESAQVSGILGAVGARTSAIGFDAWLVELGASFGLFSHTPKLGLSYLKRLDILRLTHAMRELVSGNFQLLFDRVQTVEVMAFHFAQLQRRLGEYKSDRSARSLTALELTIAQLLDVPLIPSLYKYYAMVSEVSARLGKLAALQIQGDNTTALPREQLYPLHDALVHLIRNALDHGLETPPERTARGKAERGTLVIECTSQLSQVSLVLRDDGRGIDPQLVKRKARDLGMISEQAAAELSDAQAIELVFLPHFSTARGVTDISGRGIGMDVVRESLSRIGAQLSIDSHVGRGTTFTILLPRAARAA